MTQPHDENENVYTLTNEGEPVKPTDKELRIISKLVGSFRNEYVYTCPMCNLDYYSYEPGPVCHNCGATFSKHWRNRESPLNILNRESPSNPAWDKIHTSTRHTKGHRLTELNKIFRDIYGDSTFANMLGKQESLLDYLDGSVVELKSNYIQGNDLVRYKKYMLSLVSMLQVAGFTVQTTIKPETSTQDMTVGGNDSRQNLNTGNHGSIRVVLYRNGIIPVVDVHRKHLCDTCIFGCYVDATVLALRTKWLEDYVAWRLD